MTVHGTKKKKGTMNQEGTFNHGGDNARRSMELGIWWMVGKEDRSGGEEAVGFGNNGG